MNTQELISALPSSIRVGAFDVPIEAKHDTESSFGAYETDPPGITISPTIQCRYKLVASVMHEIGHAIFDAYGLKDGESEERVVDAMATGWTQVYRDCPSLVSWMQAALAPQ